MFLEAGKPQQGASYNRLIVTPYYYSHQSDIDIDCCWNAYPISYAVLIKAVLAQDPCDAVCDGSFWLRSVEGELQQKYFLLEREHQR